MSPSAVPQVATGRWRLHRPAQTRRYEPRAGQSERARAATESGGVPFLLFCAYSFVMVVRPQDYLQRLASFRPALVLTVVTLIATALRPPKPSVNAWEQPTTKLYVWFFAIACLGIPFSMYPHASFNYLFFTYANNLVFYWLFLKHVNTFDKYRRTVVTLSLAAVAFNLLEIGFGTFRGGRLWTDSQVFDPNDSAFIQVSLLGFCMSVLVGRLHRWLGAVSVGSSALLILFSGSRGGLLGLAAIFVLFMTVGLPMVSRTKKALLLSVLSLLAIANSSRIDTNRFSTLTDLGNDYNMSEETGRLQVWTRGLILFTRHPIMGVGVNEFSEAIGWMRADEGVPPLWQAAHNSYIQVLTEMGIPGIVLYVLLIRNCLITLLRLRRRTGFSGPRALGFPPDLLLIGFVGCLVVATFLSQAYSLAFTLFFAASASLNALASRDAALETN